MIAPDSEDDGFVDEVRDAEPLPDEPAERVRAIVTRVTDELDIGATVEVEETDEEIRANVDGDDLGLLIGRRGATIDALQHVVSRAAFRGREDRKHVVVDAADYRERREEALCRSADQAVAQALEEGRSVELEPMRALERKVVHVYLRDRTDIETHSEGEEPERRLVVTPTGL
jgi:spoIIIJ-associated protein